MSTPKENMISWLIFQDEHLLIIKDTHMPLSNDIAGELHFLRKFHLGKDHHTQYYCGEISKNALPENMLLIPLKQAFSLFDEDWFSLIVKAYSIVNWDRNHQFCSRCGCTTVHQSQLLFERVCTACHLVFYPRISPSIIVLIKKEDQILMARSPHFASGVYGLIAGFVEAGENIEDAVHREVKEEVGIEIKNLRYFGSQPWPFPDSLMIGFTADYASGELSIDNQEIEAAGWYKYDELPGQPSVNMSIASKLIQHFRVEQQNSARNSANHLLTTLTPELYCSDIKRSLIFYTGTLSFHIQYQREEDGFVMLERQGSRIMLDEIKHAQTTHSRTWIPAPLERPFGRGINLEIKTTDIDNLYANIQKMGGKIFLPIEDKWYKVKSVELCNRQFIVLDPDGYMLRFYEPLDQRPCNF